MHEWMIGVGCIAVLMTPCLIAMRPSADNTEEKSKDQEASDFPSERRLKLL